MSWARVDDHANEHPKLLEVGGEAAWLWVCGLMYSNRQQRRDGHIPKQVIGMLYPFRSVNRLAKKLVQAGLWVEHEKTYEVHDYADWNKSDEQVMNEREVTRIRVARFREKRSGNGNGNAVTGNSVTAERNGVTTVTVLDPLHSTPLQAKEEDPPLPPAAASEDSESPLPLDFQLHPVSVKELAEKFRVSNAVILAAVEEFKGYWTIGGGMGKRRSHWQAKCRDDIRRKAEAGKLRSEPGGADPERQAELERLGERAKRKMRAITSGIGE